MAKKIRKRKHLAIKRKNHSKFGSSVQKKRKKKKKEKYTSDIHGFHCVGPPGISAEYGGGSNDS